MNVCYISNSITGQNGLAASNKSSKQTWLVSKSAFYA